ncbi:MAG: hypothetical protein JKY61_05855 [Planctomycetes bacterium]|nr:hypothetical protein [Planctomycetota bacterium]
MLDALHLNEGSERQLASPPPEVTPKEPAVSAAAVAISGRILQEGRPVSGATVVIYRGLAGLIETTEVGTQDSLTDAFSGLQIALEDQSSVPFLELRPANRFLDSPLPAALFCGVNQSPPRLEAETLTDSEGFFSFETAQPALYQLIARSSDDVQVVRTPPFLFKGSPIDLGPLPLSPCGTLEGRLLLTNSGILAGHTVRVLGSEATEVITDENGSFTLAGLPAGSHFLRVDLKASVFPIDLDQNKFHVRLQRGEARLCELSIEDVATTLLTLKVNHNEEPMAEGFVQFFGDANGEHTYLKLTSRLDDTGSASIRIPANTPLAMEVSLGGHVTILAGHVFPPGAAELELDIRTGALKVVLPRQNPDREVFACYLRYQLGDQPSGDRLEGTIEDTEPSDQSMGLSEVHFPTVPINAQKMELIIHSESLVDGTRHVTEHSFDAPMFQGEVTIQELPR